MAAPPIQFQVAGAKELTKLLEELPKSLTDQVLRRTGAKALEPTRQIATWLAPKRSGRMATKIVIGQPKKSQKRKRKDGTVSVFCGPDGRLRYPHLIEFGTKARFHKKTGKFVGIGPPRAFMRPAWDSTVHQVLAIERKEIWDELQKAVRRLRKRAERGKLSKSQTAFFAR